MTVHRDHAIEDASLFGLQSGFEMIRRLRQGGGLVRHEVQMIGHALQVLRAGQRWLRRYGRVGRKLWMMRHGQQHRCAGVGIGIPERFLRWPDLEDGGFVFEVFVQHRWIGVHHSRTTGEGSIGAGGRQGGKAGEQQG